jgi:hypothetical protein
MITKAPGGFQKNYFFCSKKFCGGVYFRYGVLAGYEGWLC